MGNGAGEPAAKMIVRESGIHGILRLMLSIAVGPLLLALCLCGYQGSAQTLILTLEQPCAGYSVTTAPLKYNKDFAWSFTLDDGYAAGWLVAFPYLHGGRVSPPYTDQWGHDQGGDGLEHPGLFYTDGCGHRLPFQAALAINGNSITGGRWKTDDPLRRSRDASSDTIAHPGHMSWEQLNSMHRAGWDIFNHGYRHLTGAGVNAEAEVRLNNETVAEQLSVHMNQFVVPGGKGDMISEGRYTQASFLQGMQAVHCGRFAQHWILEEGRTEEIAVAGQAGTTGMGGDNAMAGVGREEVVSGTGVLEKVLAGREFISSKVLEKYGDTLFFGELTQLQATGKKFWINIFTHSVGNTDLWGISLRYPDFSAFFDKLAARYGAAGQDNMWMASYQAVQDYLLVRHSLRYTTTQKGRKIIIRLHTGQGASVAGRRSVSFLWKSDQPVRGVECRGCRVESFSKGDALKGDPSKSVFSQIININW